MSAAMLGLAGPAGAPTLPSHRPIAGVSAAPVAQPAGVLPRSEPAGIAVPVLDLDAGLIPLGLRPDGTMEVPPDAPTVGWFTGAPTPGERGPAVVAAHVDWAGEPGAFAELATLRPGDEVRVGRTDGSTVEFVVDRVDQYPKDRFPTEAVYGNVDHAGLRLITCGGAFDRGAGGYRENVVVFASRRA